MELIEFTPRVRPAGNVNDVVADIELIETGIRIGLQRAFERLEMSLWMFSFAIR
jgi:hypothetical protein